MATEKEITSLYISLDGDQHRAMAYWHRRTTLLWNIIVAHLQAAPFDYINEAPSEASDEAMDALVDMVYSVVTGKDLSLMPEFLLSSEWSLAVSKIKELPEAVADERLKDLKRGYRSSKARVVKDPKSKPCIPAEKSERSNQSVRFNTSLFNISGDVLTLTGKLPHVQIKHPEFAKVRVAPETVLTITRRRVRPNIREEWELETSKRPYSLTFVSDKID